MRLPREWAHLEARQEGAGSCSHKTIWQLCVSLGEGLWKLWGSRALPPGDFLRAAMSCERKFYLGPGVCPSMFGFSLVLRILRSRAGDTNRCCAVQLGGCPIPGGLAHWLCSYCTWYLPNAHSSPGLRLHWLTAPYSGRWDVERFPGFMQIKSWEWLELEARRSFFRAQTKNPVDNNLWRFSMRAPRTITLYMYLEDRGFWADSYPNTGAAFALSIIQLFIRPFVSIKYWWCHQQN